MVYQFLSLLEHGICNSSENQRHVIEPLNAVIQLVQGNRY